MICGFKDAHWISEGEGDFNITADFTEIRKSEMPMSRIKCTMDTEADVKAYEVSVDCLTEGCKGVNSAYGMLSFYRADGSYIIRKYMDNVTADGSHKRCAFAVPDECVRIGIELGLKSTGYVKWENLVLKECPPISKRKVRIAATSVSGKPTHSETMTAIEKVMDEAGSRGVDLVVFSEVINMMGSGLSANEAAQKLAAGYRELMQKKAELYNTYIVINLYENGEDGYTHNTSVLIDRSGNIAGRYQKTHISFNECEHGVVPGDEYPVFETDFGKIGMLICWDAYFPEPARILALKGAELLVVSTVGDPAYRHIARAMENGVYVAVSGSGHHTHKDCYIEPSKIIAPDGEIVAQTGEYDGFAMGEIDLADKKPIYWLSTAASFAEPNNIYKNERRPELYGEI